MTILAAEVTALFDPLMASIKEKLDVLASENHLKGSAYDEVYSAALSNTLQQVVQLIIGTDQRALTAAKVQTEEQTKLNLIAEHDGIVANTAKTDAERANLVAEGLIIPKEGALKDQQLINLVAEKYQIQAKTDNIAAETLIVPKQGELIDSQIIGQGYENELKHQQGLNLALEGNNIPKQGVVLDQQALKLAGETSLIPKQSQLMDAQITELINRGQNLALEALKLQYEGDNLKVQGDNLVLQGKALTEEIALKKLEGKNKDAERIQILTNAENNRASALAQTAKTSSIYGQLELTKFGIMCDTYNTYAAHTANADIAFDTNSLAQAANQVTIAANRNNTFTMFYSGGVSS